MITDCLFRDNLADEGGAFAAVSGELSMSGCTLVDNAATTTGGALNCVALYGGALTGCTLAGNRASQGGGINVVYGGSPVLTISTTIIAFGVQGQGLWWDGSGTTQVANVDIFGNAGGDWVGPIAGQFGIGGNVSLDPLFCDPAAGDFTLDGLSPCLPSNNPHGVQIGAHGWGCGATTGVAAQPTAATRPPRLGSQPNPFNPRTAITFRLDQPVRARLDVHDVTGRLIRRLADESFGDGDHEVFWDGRDDAGNAVASGTYLAVMRTATGETSHKLVLLR